MARPKTIKTWDDAITSIYDSWPARPDSSGLHIDVSTYISHQPGRRTIAGEAKAWIFPGEIALGKELQVNANTPAELVRLVTTKLLPQVMFHDGRLKLGTRTAEAVKPVAPRQRTIAVAPVTVPRLTFKE